LARHQREEAPLQARQEPLQPHLLLPLLLLQQPHLLLLLLPPLLLLLLLLISPFDVATLGKTRPGQSQRVRFSSTTIVWKCFVLPGVAPV
jgi:hypothetical protein